MADITSSMVANPIDKGVLQTEILDTSAVVKLAGLSLIEAGQTHVYHTLTNTDGVYVGEGAPKPDTGAGIERLEVHATKFVKKYSYTYESKKVNEQLFDNLLDTQARSLANTFDKAVLGLIPVGEVRFDNFGTGTTPVTLDDSGAFWDAWGLASQVAEADGILLTTGMLARLRGFKNDFKVNVLSIQGDATSGTIEGIPYAVVKGVAEPKAIMGPWKSRAVAALGATVTRENPYAENHWVNNTVGALAEIWGGFRVVDKSEFVTLSLPEVTP